MFDYSEEVDRGVALLDSIYPKWKEKIDVDSLLMQYRHTCILGQLYGDFWKVKIINPEQYGFSCNHNIEHSYEDLTKEWKSRFVKTYNLSKEKVEPGKYKVVKHLMGLEFVSELKEGTIIEVLDFCLGSYNTRTNKEVKNMIVSKGRLFNDSPVMVQRVDSE